MGYLSCNAESAIATCDPYNWDRKKKAKERVNKPIKIRKFSYNELVAATNSFSAESFLGKGSHGSVYKAILDDGKLIAAVKKTTAAPNTTTTTAASPAENEIEILSRVQNPRLVNLIGFCSDSKGNKLIVVEYMPNGSLYDLLHSTTSRPPGWSRRVRFARQVAKAVQSLHRANPPVIHRDIKSSNVLIDDNYNARLGDFGLSLRGHVEDVRVKCTPPAGTLGYLDPGYLAPSDVSAKSDVFSFGILLLEILSGRHAIDLNYSPPSIVDWAVPMIKRSEFAGICDRRLGQPTDPAVARQLAVLAARCVRSRAEKRPDMAEVVECLKAVSKKMQSAPLIWNNFRRRVRCVERSQPSIGYEVFEGSEEVVRVSAISATSYKRIGSRRNRKVSSVSNAEYGNGSDHQAVNPVVGDNRVIRSRSVGSFSEIKGGTGLGSGSGLGLVNRRRTAVGYGVGVKMPPTVRLNKSRSMGVLQSSKLIGQCHDNISRGFNVSKFGANYNSSLDEKSEEKMLVKPLVSS